MTITGLLDAVFDLRVDYVSPSFVISWQPPFTLDIPGPIDITYCILITNVSSSSPSPLENLCGIVPANYSVNLNFDPCVEYNVMITPENMLGNGTSTTATFPGAFSILYTLRSLLLFSVLYYYDHCRTRWCGSRQCHSCSKFLRKYSV